MAKPESPTTRILTFSMPPAMSTKKRLQLELIPLTQVALLSGKKCHFENNNHYMKGNNACRICK